jgi:acetylornithine/succinyldiaminopimelate/putrescine aminotransferase
MLAKRTCWTKLGLSFAMTSSSSAGNRFACAAAIATLESIRLEGLCGNSEKQGKRFMQALSRLALVYPQVLRSVTGRGLLLGIDVPNQKAAFEIIVECARRGVLMMSAFLNRTRILIEPPLCIDDDQVDEVSRILEQVCELVSQKYYGKVRSTVTGIQ